MKPNLLNKMPGSEREILPTPKSVEEFSLKPEQKDFLTDQEKERLRQEALEKAESLEKPLVKLSVQPGASISINQPAKTEVFIKIEKILEEDLEDVFFKMEPSLKGRFKEEGEKTTYAIEEMIKTGKVEAKKIFKLILRWLKMIPNVNKFFLKQEAKIKTNKITNLQ